MNRSLLGRLGKAGTCQAGRYTCKRHGGKKEDAGQRGHSQRG